METRVTTTKRSVRAGTTTGTGSKITKSTRITARTGTGTETRVNTINKA